MNNKYILNLESEFSKNSFENFHNYSDELKLCALYAFYHYFNADSSKIDEVMGGLIPNESSIIKGIFIDYEQDIETIDVLLCDLSEMSQSDIPLSLNNFELAEKEIFGKGKYRQTIYDYFSEEDHKIGETRIVRIKTLCLGNAKNSGIKKAIKNGLAITKPTSKYVTYDYVLWPAIENDILEIEDPKEFVSEGEISIDNKYNILKFGNESSIIVNASAQSIKKLYEQYSYRGLFAQNLRYYIANPKIDNNIINSINNASDNFWYFNNGIIIICDSYDIIDKSIIMRDFSIINGGQTTFILGDTDFDHDFYVQCKIIKNKYYNETEKIDFIANVAEATNTQKPIKSKDLVANQKEQRLLKKQLADSKIFCSIKRGQKVNKKLYPEAWQNTTNEEIAQFLYSFMYQRPGSAKGNKNQLCSNPDKYSLIFSKIYDSNFLKDLLILKELYKKWARNIGKKYTKSDGVAGTNKISVSKYGMLYTYGVLGILVKNTYHNNYCERYNSLDDSDEKIELLSQYDVTHKFLNDDVNEENIFLIFDYVCDIIIDGFKYLKVFKPNYNSIANFTKLDSNYTSFVVKNLMYKLQSPLPNNLEGIWNEVLYHPNNDEKEKDTKILSEYRNLIGNEIKNKTKLPSEVTDDLKEELKKYRTKIYKAKHIKAYEVFIDKSMKILAMYGASTVEDLIDLKCFDQKQIDNYGSDILEIVKNVMNRHNF